MTKDELVRLVYISGHCPEYNCQHTTSAQCMECHNKELTEYENEIYNKVLEDYTNKALEMLKTEQDTRYGYLDSMDIREIAEQLKKGKEE